MLAHLRPAAPDPMRTDGRGRHQRRKGGSLSPVREDHTSGVPGRSLQMLLHGESHDGTPGLSTRYLSEPGALEHSPRAVPEPRRLSPTKRVDWIPLDHAASLVASVLDRASQQGRRHAPTPPGARHDEAANGPDRLIVDRSHDARAAQPREVASWPCGHPSDRLPAAGIRDQPGRSRPSGQGAKRLPAVVCARYAFGRCRAPGLAVLHAPATAREGAPLAREQRL